MRSAQVSATQGPNRAVRGRQTTRKPQRTKEIGRQVWRSAGLRRASYEHLRTSASSAASSSRRLQPQRASGLPSACLSRRPGVPLRPPVWATGLPGSRRCGQIDTYPLQTRNIFAVSSPKGCTYRGRYKVGTTVVTRLCFQQLTVICTYLSLKKVQKKRSPPETSGPGAVKVSLFSSQVGTKSRKSTPSMDLTLYLPLYLLS